MDIEWNTAYNTNMTKNYTLQLHDIILGPFKRETSLKYILHSVLALSTCKASCPEELTLQPNTGLKSSI